MPGWAFWAMVMVSPLWGAGSLFEATGAAGALLVPRVEAHPPSRSSANIASHVAIMTPLWQRLRVICIALPLRVRAVATIIRAAIEIDTEGHALGSAGRTLVLFGQLESLLVQLHQSVRSQLA